MSEFGFGDHQPLVFPSSVFPAALAFNSLIAPLWPRRIHRWDYHPQPFDIMADKSLIDALHAFLSEYQLAFIVAVSCFVLVVPPPAVICCLFCWVDLNRGPLSNLPSVLVWLYVKACQYPCGNIQAFEESGSVCCSIPFAIRMHALHCAARRNSIQIMPE